MAESAAADRTYGLRDLVDIPTLQAILDAVDEVQSLPSALIDAEGNVLTATAWQDICTQFHRACPETAACCKESDTHIAREIGATSSPVVYECPFGLVDAAAPVIVEGRHLGNFFTGQLFTAPPDPERFRRQARQYGYDERAYLDAVRKVPVVAEERLHKNLKFLGHLALALTGIDPACAQEVDPPS